MNTFRKTLIIFAAIWLLAKPYSGRLVQAEPAEDTYAIVVYKQ